MRVRILYFIHLRPLKWCVKVWWEGVYAIRNKKWLKLIELFHYFLTYRIWMVDLPIISRGTDSWRLNWNLWNKDWRIWPTNGVGIVFLSRGGMRVPDFLISRTEELSDIMQKLDQSLAHSIWECIIRRLFARTHVSIQKVTVWRDVIFIIL